MAKNSLVDQFQEMVLNESVELIEAKNKLNGVVLGQVIVGYNMFERQYIPEKSKLVVLCKEADPD